jgi:hypothetical protein
VKRNIVILLLLAMVASALAVYAFEPTTPEENDPSVNFDANACFIGGSWYGKCGTDDVLWNAGWYLIRFDAGLITRGQVPDQFKWSIPEEVVEDTVVPTPGKPVMPK